MKNHSTTLREYSSRISDDDLKYLHTRLSQRLSGDVAEALQLLGRTSDVDRVFRDAGSGEGIYGAIDELQACLQREFEKRFGK